MWFSCTCTLPDSLWCNHSTIVLCRQYWYILLGDNSTQSPTFQLVCNDSQCQNQATVNLVMRSVLQTLYRLEFILIGCISYVDHPTRTIMPLSAASCEQGACPSLSQGCRNITQLSIAQVNCLSVDIVTMLNLYYAQKCEQCCLVLVDSEQFSTFFGTTLLGSTRRRINFPLMSRFCAFK